MKTAIRIALVSLATVATIFVGLFCSWTLLMVAAKVGGNAGAVLAVLALASAVAVIPVAIFNAMEVDAEMGE
jgi:hypothetical protein